MGKALFLYMVFLMLGIMPFVSGLNLEVEKIDKGSVVISELQNSAVFDLVINNKGEEDSVEIYSLAGITISPKYTFSLPSGKSTVEIKVLLNEEFKNRVGSYSFGYEIRGQNQGIFNDKLSIQVVPIKNIFELSPSEIKQDDNSVNIEIKNKVNANLDNVKTHFSSIFFDAEKTLDFKTFEKISVPIELDKSKNQKLIAGPYIFSADVFIENVSVKYENMIDYLENEKIISNKEITGFLIRETKIIKTNEGNVPVRATIEMRKDIISRLFTTFSAGPLEIERHGLVVDYMWQEDIKPGDSYSIGVTTNYTFIVILVVLVVLIAFLMRTYSLTSLRVHKSVSFVKTKGGEFALKIRLRVKARKAVKGIQIIDRMPAMSTLYDKIGKRPDKIDAATRRLFWNIGYLNKGEERVFSYIIYSKLRAVGRFELPAAMAIFDKDGKRQEVSSNRAYFVSETTTEE